MTHYPMTHIDLTEGTDRRTDPDSGAAPQARHARLAPAHHHAANSLPATHVLLLALSAVVVLIAVLAVAMR
ncbi:hypothetical protein [Actinacidiphila rubida]|nr:hypothetical protein [Actinacidiphila rubida]